MTVTVASFRTRFPEFGTSSVTSDEMIQTCLDEAADRTPESVWGSGVKRDAGIRYLAAHLLAMSPQARELKLSTPDGNSAYLPERRRLQYEVASGFRVTGDTTGIDV